MYVHITHIQHPTYRMPQMGCEDKDGDGNKFVRVATCEVGSAQESGSRYKCKSITFIFSCIFRVFFVQLRELRHVSLTDLPSN